MLNMVSSRRGWTNRLCQLNIFVIIISLAAIKYKVGNIIIFCKVFNKFLFQFLAGCIPAVFVCGLDVIFCSMYGLQCVYSLIINSLKTIIAAFLAVCVGAVAMIYGQLMLDLLSKNKFL